MRLKPATNNYKQIGNKSPIVDITKSLVDKISKKSELDVDFIMRYTPPFASDVLYKYKDYNEIILLPLYPHHSVTTVKSSLDDVKREYVNLGMKNSVRVIDIFYEIILDFLEFYKKSYALSRLKSACGSCGGKYPS